MASCHALFNAQFSSLSFVLCLKRWGLNQGSLFVVTSGYVGAAQWTVSISSMTREQTQKRHELFVMDKSERIKGIERKRLLCIYLGIPTQPLTQTLLLEHRSFWALVQFITPTQESTCNDIFHFSGVAQWYSR